MIFNELTFYAIFLGPSAILFHWSQRFAIAPLLRPWILAAFGAVFFVYYSQLHFGGFWAAVAILLLLWELGFSRLYRRGSRFCLIGVAQAVLVLVAFKYVGFLTEIVSELGVGFGANIPAPPKLLLPLGISFFTFEFVHFAVDVHRGRLDRVPFANYAAFLFFFPTMVAGPIKRYQDFGPQLPIACATPALVTRGITRILTGLAKKHVIADSLTLVSDRLVSGDIASPSLAESAVGILAYGMKIYFDFSGYSDIAIGSGYLFGLHIPENFQWPYLSRNISEFWRRWHISLGRWIFDYVYAPLGGSRGGPVRTGVNLLVTFAVSGLWHGAAYNFVLWGLWHGVMMVAHRAWQALPRRPTGRIWTALSTVMTFIGVNVGWAFFCMDTNRLRQVIAGVLP
jgi:alginate O-acetyltransferase complex protein AlgI